MIDCIRVYCKNKDLFGWPNEPVLPVCQRNSPVIVEDVVEIVHSSDTLKLLDR